MFPDTKKNGTRVHSPKPPFYETALLFPLNETSKIMRTFGAGNQITCCQPSVGDCQPSTLPTKDRERKISPKFSCIKMFQIRDVPTQIPGDPGHSLSKTTDRGHLLKVFVRDIPTSGSLMSQEYPAQKLYLWAVFSIPTKDPLTNTPLQSAPAELPKYIFSGQSR